jgi:hypothetical protein
MGVMSSRNVSCNIAFARTGVFCLGRLWWRYLLLPAFVTSINVQTDAEALCGRQRGVLEGLHLEAPLLAQTGIRSNSRLIADDDPMHPQRACFNPMPWISKMCLFEAFDRSLKRAVRNRSATRNSTRRGLIRAVF